MSIGRSPDPAAEYAATEAAKRAAMGLADQDHPSHAYHAPSDCTPACRWWGVPDARHAYHLQPTHEMVHTPGWGWHAVRLQTDESAELKGEPMEAREMEAGRELDAMVAERVMGWKRGDCYWIMPENPTEPYGTGYTHSAGDYDFEDFAPSEIIAHAWGVVDAMLNRDVEFSMNTVIPNSDPVWFEVKFEFFATNRFTIGGATNPALAICRAALAFVQDD